MKTQEYQIKILDYPTKSDGYQVGIIEVFRDHDGTDLALRFLCPCGESKIYIPLGADNNEPGGSSPRQMFWIEKDKVMSIHPSIKVRGGCNEHFHIFNNKVCP